MSLAGSDEIVDVVTLFCPQATFHCVMFFFALTGEALSISSRSNVIELNSIFFS